MASAADQLARLTMTLVSEPDEQGRFLMRELQRTRARVTHHWPMPERIGDDTDVVLCEYVPDLSRRYAWMPGEASAATIVLLRPGAGFDPATIRTASPDAVLHRPYQTHTITTALALAWDHFSYCRRQRTRLARLDENIRATRDIERAKHLIMTERNIDESQAYSALRSLAMERRVTVAALAASLIDSRRILG